MIKVVQCTLESTICLQVTIWSEGERADSKDRKRSHGQHNRCWTMEEDLWMNSIG